MRTTTNRQSSTAETLALRPFFLRMAGKDGLVLTGDVMCALVAWGALEREPKGKTGRREARQAFNRRAAETGRPLCHLSMILARSID